MVIIIICVSSPCDLMYGLNVNRIIFRRLRHCDNVIINYRVNDNVYHDDDDQQIRVYVPTAAYRHGSASENPEITTTKCERRTLQQYRYFIL